MVYFFTYYYDKFFDSFQLLKCPPEETSGEIVIRTQGVAEETKLLVNYICSCDCEQVENSIINKLLLISLFKR